MSGLLLAQVAALLVLGDQRPFRSELRSHGVPPTNHKLRIPLVSSSKALRARSSVSRRRQVMPHTSHRRVEPSSMISLRLVNRPQESHILELDQVTRNTSVSSE